MNTFVTHLEAAIDGTHLAAGQIHTVHNGKPIWVRYDLDSVSRQLPKEDLIKRPNSLWRYRELLPLPMEVEPVTLGEGMTPQLSCPRLGKHFRLDQLWIKDESQLPTGSFKSRGMSVAVSMAHHFGINRLAVPTAGNAGGALAAYGARAGMEVFIFMPEDTPVINQIEASLAGAHVFLVNGLINDCGRIVREGSASMGWFDMSTLKEPYRLEGKKTMGLELGEQNDWVLPDAILYPTGGGTGLIGMWKAFQEMKQMGWLKSGSMPRLYSCQSNGCAPIVQAFEKKQRFADPFENAHTLASGLRVPVAVGDFMMLDAIRESNGSARVGDEFSIKEWMQKAASLEGISLCPESAICLDVLNNLVEEGEIKPSEKVVIFNTGASQKYPEVAPVRLPRINKNHPVDYQSLVDLSCSS